MDNLMEWLRDNHDDIRVSLAIKGNFDKLPLEPRLWEPLRVELQRIYRRATGEPHATLVLQEPTNER